MIRMTLIAAFLTLAAPAAAQETATLSARAQSAEGPFEQGSYQALMAIETLLQTRYRYGIGRSIGAMMGMRGLRNLGNPDPAPREADTFAKMMQVFAGDLEAARETLAAVTPETAEPFEMPIHEIWVDINADGIQDEGEGLMVLILATLADGNTRRNFEMPEGGLVARFDGADHAWLTAYTHLLSALTEGVLAFDPTPVFADLAAAQARMEAAPEIPYTFDVDAILAEVADLEEQLRPLNEAIAEKETQRTKAMQRLGEIADELAESAISGDKRNALQDEDAAIRAELRGALNSFDLTQQRRALNQQIRRAKSKLPPEHLSEAEQNLADNRAWNTRIQIELRNALYSGAVALRQQPDPERIGAAAGHLRAMLAQNRLFWAALATETDNDAEWIPNPRQTSVLGLQVSGDTAGAWQAVLDDAEALLDGRLLFPHPLLPPGIGFNLAAYIENPGPVDLWAWIHGRGIYDYAARGPMITEQSWRAFSQQTGGRGFGFALFFN